MLKYLLITSLLLMSSFSSAEIYRCVDAGGAVSFSDQECDAGDTLVEIKESDINALPFGESIELDDSGLEVIYEGKRIGTESRFLRVSIYEETDTYIIFYVEGYYNKIHGGKAEFRVFPNTHWGARSYSTTEHGLVNGYARVGLGSKSEGSAESDIITLQLWEYKNGKTHGILETKIVPFKKKWIKE